MAATRQARFVRDVIAAAEPYCVATGVPLALAVAQAALESGWGRAMPSNPWGMRGVGDAGSNVITTKESSGKGDGSTVTMTGQKFAKFSSLNAAAEGYCRYMSTGCRANGSGLPVDERLLHTWGVCTYATADNYVATVAAVSSSVAKVSGREDLRIVLSPAVAKAAKACSKLKPGSQRAKAAKGYIADIIAARTA